MAPSEHIITLLRQVELFQQLHRGVFATIIPRMNEQVFDAGEVLFREGDPGDRLYVLLQGSVHVYVERAGKMITYNILEAGSCFGEMALIEEAPRSANVRAEGPCRCLTLGKEDFLDLLHQHPHVALAIIHGLCQRLRSTNEQMQDYIKQFTTLS